MGALRGGNTNLILGEPINYSPPEKREATYNKEIGSRAGVSKYSSQKRVAQRARHLPPLVPLSKPRNARVRAPVRLQQQRTGARHAAQNAKVSRKLPRLVPLSDPVPPPLSGTPVKRASTATLEQKPKIKSFNEILAERSRR